MLQKQLYKAVGLGVLKFFRALLACLDLGGQGGGHRQVIYLFISEYM